MKSEYFPEMALPRGTFAYVPRLVRLSLGKGLEVEPELFDWQEAESQITAPPPPTHLLDFSLWILWFSCAFLMASCRGDFP